MNNKWNRKLVNNVIFAIDLGNNNYANVIIWKNDSPEIVTEKFWK